MTFRYATFTAEWWLWTNFDSISQPKFRIDFHLLLNLGTAGLISELLVYSGSDFNTPCSASIVEQHWLNQFQSLSSTSSIRSICYTVSSCQRCVYCTTSAVERMLNPLYFYCNMRWWETAFTLENCELLTKGRRKDLIHDQEKREPKKFMHLCRKGGKEKQEKIVIEKR